MREEVDRLIECGEQAKAYRLLGELWRQYPGPAQASFVVSRYERLRPGLPHVTSRIAILRSFTVEPAIPVLRAAAAMSGIDLVVQVGDFNAYAQELLAPGSDVYRFAPDIAVLAVQARDIAPDLWENFAALSPVEVNAAQERIIDNYRTWVGSFRKQSKAHLIIHNLERPVRPTRGILDDQDTAGQIEVIRRINRELGRIAGQHPGVYLLDYDELIARYGREQWYDERKWLTMRLPFVSGALTQLANEWLHFIHPLTGKTCKALVTDLDNTLWGGVIGEDGMNGIEVDSEYPGAAYRALQLAMLDLYHRGIILTICSKNNLEDATEVLKHHPGMLLRLEHFAALRINWNNKVQGLHEIAEELNIGLEALAFMDDNPVERELVRTELPEVTVIDLPDDPMGYATALRNSAVFERLAISAEDRDRGRHYAEQRERKELRESAVSIEDFYRSLQQEVEIALVNSNTCGRVAQLTQKTNQFNLTTRRYTEQQIADFAAQPDWAVFSVRVRDRFGDNGLVGVAITQQSGGVCEIDTFLLSCRVIGRTVETAMLAHLVSQARAQMAAKLQGWFWPTKKNAPAREFYRMHDFRPVQERDGGTLWSLDLSQSDIVCPDWIRLTISKGVAT